MTSSRIPYVVALSIAVAQFGCQIANADSSPSAQTNTSNELSRALKEAFDRRIAQAQESKLPAIVDAPQLRGPVTTTTTTAVPGSSSSAGDASLRGPIGGTTTVNTTTSTTTTPGVDGTNISAPLVGPSETNEAAQAAKSLKGLANVTSVTATANMLPRIPFQRLRDDSLEFVQVTLRNDSQQVAVINGDASQASIGAGISPAVTGKYITLDARPGLTGKKVAAIAAATGGSFALAGPMMYEYVTPGQHRRRSLGLAIGVDGTRHQVEAERFGVRVLMPGDESVGWMAFSCEPTETIKTVTIPLSFSRSLAPDGVLEVPVRALDSTLGPQNAVQNQKAALDAINNAKQSAAHSGAPAAGPSSFLQDQSMDAGVLTGSPSTANPVAPPLENPTMPPVQPPAPVQTQP